MKTIDLFIVSLAVVTIIFHLSAGASEREREPDHQTINNIFNVHKHDREDTVKGIILGFVITCRLNAVRAALFDGQWWTWCGEPKPAPDLPKPGPVVNNDVTPDQPVGVKLYQ